ncbi:hypothetical protein LTR08_003530 [Meristemomyces frigidus]|nr:hypothetical protein LTR08_003530 [Meristemomyces frigidus]
MASSITTTTSKTTLSTDGHKAASGAMQSSSSVLLLGTLNTAKRLSASCQQVIAEESTERTARVIVRSCLADSELYPIISGHKCNKVPLCPSSLYADMALTVGAYLWNTLSPETKVPGMDLTNMECPKPFIAQVPQTQPGQFIEMEAEAELEGELGVVRCQWRSVRPDGSKIQDHASCLLKYEDCEKWVQEWSRFDHMVKNSIKALHAKMLAGGAHQMQSGLAYQVFESFVTYPAKYRGMNEVTFNGLEGTSTLEFKTTAEDHCGPYHIDNSCHLSGFLCNASDMEGEDNVYVSEGWHSAKYLNPAAMFRPGSQQPKLTNYCLMQPRGKSLLQGDVYIFQEDKMVAVMEGIKFKQLPRRVVNIFLPPPKRA